MVEAKTQVSIEEFERLAQSSDLRLELVRGEVVEMSPDNWEHSGLSLHVARVLEPPAQGAGGSVRVNLGFVLNRDPRIVRGPDVAYVSAERLPPPERRQRFFEGAPDLAIEIVSPGDSAAYLHDKVEDYLTYGARLVWVLYPGTRTVTVHDPDRTARTLTARDTLSGGDILPGFQVRVADLFSE